MEDDGVNIEPWKPLEGPLLELMLSSVWLLALDRRLKSFKNEGAMAGDKGNSGGHDGRRLDCMENCMRRRQRKHTHTKKKKKKKKKEEEGRKIRTAR